MALTFQLISSSTLGSNQSSFAFTSIPATYTDLYVMASLRDATSGSSLLSVRNSINNSASAIYSTTQIISSGTSMTGSRVADGTTMYAGAMMGNGALLIIILL
jgi:hypothetical protein